MLQGKRFSISHVHTTPTATLYHYLTNATVGSREHRTDTHIPWRIRAPVASAVASGHTQLSESSE